MQAAEPPPNAVTCIGRCVTFLDPGTYRVVVEGTPTLRDGNATLSVSMDEAGDYLIEGRPRERRGLGLLLGSLGIPVTMVGAGILLGSESFDSRLSGSQERWFWVGTGAFAAGLTMMPLGFLMMSSRPEVSRLTPAGQPAPRRAEPTSQVAARPRAPSYHEGLAVPRGYVTREEPRWGLLTSGALVLASSYGVMAAIAAGNLVSDSSTDLSYGLIPLIGPVLIARKSKRDESALWTVYGTIPQLAGGILLFLGTALPKTSLVRLPVRASVTPWATYNAGGISLSGDFSF